MQSEIMKIWNNTYKDNLREELGWYEDIPEPSFSLIKRYISDKTKRVLDAGCGESKLIQELLNSGFKDIEGIDLSYEAIKFLNSNLTIPKDAKVTLKNQDLTETLTFEKNGILWHDRAVFHFLKENDLKERYKNNLKNFLSKDGIFILACFSKENTAEKCNGFSISKYNADELEEFFKDTFLLKETLTFDYEMPSKDIRKYIYCIFVKK